MSLLKVASSSSLKSCLQFKKIALLVLVCGLTASSAATAAPANKTLAKAASKAPAGKPHVDNSGPLTGYFNRTRLRVQNNWQVPDGKNTVVLTATINADGSTSDVVATGHPKDGQAEVSATDAFNKSLPLEALPAGVTSAKITINFEYSYDPHGDGFHKVSGQISQTGSQQAQPASTAAPAEGGAKF